MNDNQIKQYKQKIVVDVPLEINCHSPINQSSGCIKSLTLINSLLNIFPDIGSSNSLKSRNQINIKNEKSISEMSPSERVNFYVSKLQNKRQEYEEQQKQEVQKIKIIRMKEEKQKQKEKQGPYPKHLKQFIIRKSPDQFEKQKFLPFAQKISSLSPKKQSSDEQSKINEEIILEDDKITMLIKKQKEEQQQKELQEEKVKIENREKNWKQCRSRYDYFIDSFKSTNSNNTSSYNFINKFKIINNNSITQNSFLTNRKRSNPELISHSKQSLQQQQYFDRPQSGNIYTKSFLNSKRSDPNLIKSILKQNINTTPQNENITEKQYQSQKINNQSNIKRVNFQYKSQLSPIQI